MCFICESLCLILVLFEAAFLPVLVLLFFFGDTPEKIRASSYLVVLSLSSSVGVLVFFSYWFSGLYYMVNLLLS